MKTILVTGGAGYIGSHTLVELYKAGHTAVVVDNLCNSSSESLKRVRILTGCEIPFYQVDIRDPKGLDGVLGITNFLVGQGSGREQGHRLLHSFCGSESCG